MKCGLLVFPSLYNTFHAGTQTLYAQRLEPSVLYVAPHSTENIFVPDNKPRDDIDLYLCSVYTRGWNEFRRFSQLVGRKKIIAGGYHPTALPQEVFQYAHKVVTGYCGNIDEIIVQEKEGIFSGTFGFTPMKRDLLDMTSLCQVYPDIMPGEISGSMVTSVGCPYACEFCSTPQMSGRNMRVAQLEYVEKEIVDLQKHGVTTVFIRDESFATNPQLKEISSLFKGKFRMVYSFGTGAVIAKREDYVKHLVEQGWHSLNFGLEDIGVAYAKNRDLKQATENCRRYGMKYVMSFIVNDDGKTREQALANYRALYDAFCDYKPAQVCANFLMPFPGTQIWQKYKGRIREEDFDKFDSKTPLFSLDVAWHKRMLVALQLKYYYSEVYNTEVRQFACGDTLHLRLLELSKEFDLEDGKWDDLL